MMTLQTTTTTVGEPRKTTLPEEPNAASGSDGQRHDQCHSKVMHVPSSLEKSLPRLERQGAPHAWTHARSNITPTIHTQARAASPAPSPTNHPPFIYKAKQHLRSLADWRRELLNIAGDVEVNPGPAAGEETKKCGECQKTIRTGPGFLTCNICGIFSHKQKRCSLTTKHELEKIDQSQWKCVHCRQAVTEENDENSQQSATRSGDRKYCRECEGYIKRGDNHLECKECNKPCHKNPCCSGMSRDRIRLMREGTWVCKECKDPEAYARTVARDKAGAGKKSNCFICKKMIKASDRRMECSNCKKETHLKEECSGEIRKAINSMVISEWQCPRCIDV